MDFLNEFGKRFSNVARSVSEKSKEGAELSRLNGEVKASEAALEQLYARYGRLCYARREGGGDPVVRERIVRTVSALFSLKSNHISVMPM